nr:hypothetical protein [uncultured Draconibacterium sp.]
MDKYFLYIDILGFSELVKNDTKIVDELYEIIASLNVHDHNVFKTIIFSDTILVYNDAEPIEGHDHRYIVMFLCEFVQDLQNRLTGRNIVYRAIITKGQFIHYEINKIPCFYGSALIDAYNSEKGIQAIGLFIDKSCKNRCVVFKTLEFNEKYDFVFTTQALERVEYEYEGDFPIDYYEVDQTELDWSVTPEIITLENIYRNSINHPEIKVRAKYENTFKLYEKHYPKTVKCLIENNFSPTFISPKIDWQEKIDRFPEDYSFIKTMKK